MTGDRMVIRKKSKDSLLIDEQNNVRDLKPCSYFPQYKGLRKPKCNCAPCWDLWVTKQRDKE